MDRLEKKTFTTSRKLTYTYYNTPNPSTSQNPTILLLHGWPDDAHLFEKIVPVLLQTDYPLLIPDLLGYGETSKPTDMSLYNYRDMSADLVEILKSEKITQVICAGHDWGAGVASYFFLFYPHLVAGLILLSV